MLWYFRTFREGVLGVDTRTEKQKQQDKKRKNIKDDKDSINMWKGTFSDWGPEKRARPFRRIYENQTDLRDVITTLQKFDTSIIHTTTPDEAIHILNRRIDKLNKELHDIGN